MAATGAVVGDRVVHFSVRDCGCGEEFWESSRNGVTVYSSRWYVNRDCAKHGWKLEVPR